MMVAMTTIKMATSGFHLVRQILQCWDKVMATLVKPSAVLIFLKGSVKERQGMLEEFLSACENMSSCGKAF